MDADNACTLSPYSVQILCGSADDYQCFPHHGCWYPVCVPAWFTISAGSTQHIAQHDELPDALNSAVEVASKEPLSRAAKRRERQRKVIAKWAIAGANLPAPGMVSGSSPDRTCVPEPLRNEPQRKKCRSRRSSAVRCRMVSVPEDLGEDEDQKVDHASWRGRLACLRAGASAVDILGDPTDASDDAAFCADLLSTIQECDVALRSCLVSWFTCAAREFALSGHGCRVLQAALTAGDTADHHTLALYLAPHVFDLCESPHGNYVLAKLIEVLPCASMSFIIERFLGRTCEAARHQFGCRILERLIEHCPGDQLEQLLNELLAEVDELARHSYGNFVIQHVLEHGGPFWQSRTIHKLTPFLPSLAMHRVGSYVVRGAIAHSCKGDCATMVVTMLAAEGKHSLEALTTNHYGSLVLAHLLCTRHDETTAVQERLCAVLPQLTVSEFGLRVVKHLR